MTSKEEKLTKAQRRAYIDTQRRSQPVEELERKARKAISRRRRYPPEQTDLTFARDWRWGLAHTWTDCGGFCYLCHKFGVWAGPLGYIAPPQHATRCRLSPIDDGPYPGWDAAGRTALERSGG
jgi:hypothetical protein